jgi:hypothetical protein
MMNWQRFGWLALGLVLGGLGAAYYTSRPRLVQAGSDRADDCIMCTGPVVVDMKNTQIDGVWLLDYRAGKLLGSLVDRGFGKVLHWAEVDLVKEFNIAPKQQVHFMMTTGMPVHGQTALYVAETMTGRFAVYTMRPMPDPRMGVIISRHDATKFR